MSIPNLHRDKVGGKTANNYYTKFALQIKPIFHFREFLQATEE